MCSCQLWHFEHDRKIEHELPLYGTLVSTGTIIDLGSKESIYFTFPDLSVLVLGKFRLRFAVYQISDSEPDHPLFGTILSDIFTVYSKREYPGVLGISI